MHLNILSVFGFNALPKITPQSTKQHLKPILIVDVLSYNENEYPLGHLIRNICKVGIDLLISGGVSYVVDDFDTLFGQLNSKLTSIQEPRLIEEPRC